MEILLRALAGVGSIFVCALPERYRRWWPVRNESELRGPAILSGVLEALTGSPGAVLYIAAGLNAARGGWGIAGLIMNPWFPFLYIFIEGLFRTLAAVGSGQVLPTLPLQVVAWIHDASERGAGKRELGPVARDIVRRGDGKSYDLYVLSSRAKSHWNSYMTIRFEGEFYQMFREEWATGSRKFAYFLRKCPDWHHVVVVYEYRPDEAFDSSSPPQRWKPDFSS